MPFDYGHVPSVSYVFLGNSNNLGPVELDFDPQQLTGCEMECSFHHLDFIKRLTLTASFIELDAHWP